MGLIRLAGGTVLTVEADWLQPPSARNEGWELRGDRGAASISPPGCGSTAASGWTRRPRRGRWPL